ncbi:hypothetical protein CABS03_06233 [Colletotrichum abscissum]|uniref:Uncharacterized protein n=2 Tax=Colletotrichum acutatum species complex TaxID=2707335 RepID=A0A9P9X915_9PEZI|nr:hypothetical protein CABS02_10487 [Colletotrichum abscissum]KAK0373028.1 hypothetical protein CLIM01_09615 [Colletotrichum limetticola]
MCSHAGADWLGRLEQTRHWSEDECVCEDDEEEGRAGGRAWKDDGQGGTR